jgi:hypothetical protein
MVTALLPVMLYMAVHAGFSAKGKLQWTFLVNLLPFRSNGQTA